MTDSLYCLPEIITTLLIGYQFSSVAQSCPTLCDLMNRSTPGLPVHHQLLESTQIHVHRVNDATQPSHPLSSPSPPASVVPFSSRPQSFPASGSFQMSQFFSSGGQSIGVSTSTSVFPMNSQDWSPLGWTGWISLQSSKGLSRGLSRVFSNTTVQKHQFFSAQLSIKVYIQIKWSFFRSFFKKVHIQQMNFIKVSSVCFSKQP